MHDGIDVTRSYYSSTAIQKQHATLFCYMWCLDGSNANFCASLSCKTQ